MTSFLPAYRLRVFAHRSVDSTETTVLTPIAGAAHSNGFRLTTINFGDATYKLYLGLPEGRRGRIDPLSKKTDVGEITIGVLDVRAGGVTDNLTRWMTAFLGDVGDQHQMGGCKVRIEESTNGGGAWTDFFIGRIASLTLRGKLWYDLVIRDSSEQLKGDIFVGKPHPSATYAQLFSQLPVGMIKAYGQIPLTTPLVGVTDNIDSAQNFTHITVNTSQHVRLDDVMTDDLWSTADGFINTLPPTALNPLRFTGTGIVHVKRLDTSAEGDFRLGAVQYNPTVIGGAGVLGLYIQPLRYPIGVATGTPLTVGSHSAGVTNIATDGWTISITGILKQGDIISFASHATRYFVTIDRNSDGSGAATVGINPALVTTTGDNNAITVQSSPSRMALPPNATNVEFSIVRDARLREENPNCLLVNDVHPVTFWKHILDGYFGQLYRDDDVAGGILLPASKNLGDPKRVIAYNSAAFTALIADLTIPTFRAPISQFVPMNEFIEEFICKPYGLGYYLNGAGEVVPVDLRHPASLGGIVSLTDADLDTAAPQHWEFDDTASITSAVGIRYAETFSLAEAFGDPGPPRHLPQGSAVPRPAVRFPTIRYPSRGQPLSREFVYENSRGNLFDDRPYEVDAIGLRAQPGEFINLGASIIMDRGIWADHTLQGLMRIPQRPFGRGPATIRLRFRRTGNVTPTQPGTVNLVQITSLPDPATNLRGGTRLLRCLERAERGSVIDFTFLDLGTSAVATAPTLGAPSQITGETQFGAQVAVTLNVSDQSAEVHFAVTETSVAVKPDDTSVAWTFAQMIFQSMIVQVHNLLFGKRIWWRARTFDLLGVQVPSAWAYPTPQFIDLAGFTAPSAMAVSLITDTTAHLAWTNGDNILPTALYLVTPTGDPLQLIAILLPATSAWDLAGLTANTQYKVEVRHHSRGAETAGSSAIFTTTNSPSTCPAGGRTTILYG